MTFYNINVFILFCVYPLVEKNKSLPKEVNLYIIPDAQIKMITVKLVEKEPREFYEFYKDWRWV